MSTLKLLEEDEQLPPPPESRVTAWVNQQPGKYDMKYDSCSGISQQMTRCKLWTGAICIFKDPELIVPYIIKYC